MTRESRVGQGEGVVEGVRLGVALGVRVGVRVLVGRRVAVAEGVG